MSEKPAASSEQGSEKKNPPPGSIAPFCFKKGQSDNPAGGSKKNRARPLAAVLVSYLENIPPEELRKLAKWHRKKRKNKNERPPETLQRAQLFIIELYKRATGGSDFLMSLVFERRRQAAAGDRRPKHGSAAPHDRDGYAASAAAIPATAADRHRHPQEAGGHTSSKEVIVYTTHPVVYHLPIEILNRIEGKHAAFSLLE